MLVDLTRLGYQGALPYLESVLSYLLYQQ